MPQPTSSARPVCGHRGRRCAVTAGGTVLMHSAVQLLELGAIILALGLLGALAVRFSISAIPLYLLAGLAFGTGGILPLTTSEDFVAIGAEVG